MCLKAFARQRHQAKQRGIEWDLDFAEWWAIWESSGKLNQRGRGKNKYCMARKGDSGPYTLGNVKIITFQQNIIDYHKRNTKKEGRYERLKRMRDQGMTLAAIGAVEACSRQRVLQILQRGNGK